LASRKSTNKEPIVLKQVAIVVLSAVLSALAELLWPKKPK
jgi:hypothetical protein